MSKILVIQPHRMLRQAITLFLFPAHEVQVTESVPQSLPAGDFDAVIVDAASLRETTGLDAKTMDRIQNLTVPTVWIDSRESTQRPKRDKLVIVQAPIDKEKLQSALAHCLNSPITAKRNGTSTSPGEGKRRKEKEKGEPVATENLQVIELVDIVEDAPTERSKKI